MFEKTEKVSSEFKILTKNLMKNLSNKYNQLVLGKEKLMINLQKGPYPKMLRKDPII